jgi:hypothetical protein
LSEETYVHTRASVMMVTTVVMRPVLTIRIIIRRIKPVEVALKHNSLLVNTSYSHLSKNTDSGSLCARVRNSMIMPTVVQRSMTIPVTRGVTEILCKLQYYRESDERVKKGIPQVPRCPQKQ